MLTQRTVNAMNNISVGLKEGKEEMERGVGGYMETESNGIRQSKGGEIKFNNGRKKEEGMNEENQPNKVNYGYKLTSF